MSGNRKNTFIFILLASGMILLILGGMIIGSERYVVCNLSGQDITVVYQTIDGKCDSIRIEATKWKLIGKKMVIYKKPNPENKCSANQYFIDIKIYVSDSASYIDANKMQWLCSSQPRLNEFTFIFE